MNRISLNPTAASSRKYSDVNDMASPSNPLRTQPIVWVIQEGNNDYAPAEKYGEVRFVTRADLRSIPSSSVNEQAIIDIKDFVAQYDPEIDYIVPVGNPMMTIFVATLVAQKADIHNYLKWDGRQADYVVFKMSNTEGVIR